MPYSMRPSLTDLPSVLLSKMPQNPEVGTDRAFILFRFDRSDLNIQYHTDHMKLLELVLVRLMELPILLQPMTKRQNMRLARAVLSLAQNEQAVTEINPSPAQHVLAEEVHPQYITLHDKSPCSPHSFSSSKF
jgi:hypothetical protein